MTMVFCHDCGCGAFASLGTVPDSLNLLVRCLKCRKIKEVEPDDLMEDIGV